MKQANNSFTIGFFAIISITSLIGFLAYSSYHADQNTDNKKISNTDTTQIQKNITTNPNTNNIEQSKGNLNAKVTIIEYSDIQCPYCARYHATLEQIIATYPDDVRLVYKHFPLDRIHTYARKAAEASECAGDQDKFWEYLNKLYVNQRSISPAYISETAKMLGLDYTQFNECLTSNKYAAKVEADYKEGQGKGVSGTPGSLINGKLYKGALDYDNLKQLIESLK